MAALIQFANGAPGIKYTLDKRQIVIGRSSAKADVCLPCGFVSKRHAIIELTDSLTNPFGYDYYLEDLDSTNKTYVNDKQITRVKLEHGDIVQIGKTTMKFDCSGVVPQLEPVEVSENIPPDGQSRTWNFSRRLSLLGEDEDEAEAE